MVSLARKNLLEDFPRFLVAQSGITLAVSLITLQTGVLFGFAKSTAMLIQGSGADLWISSRNMVHLELTESLRVEDKEKIMGVEGVAQTELLILGSAILSPLEGDINPIRVIGFDPQGQLFQPGEIVQGDRAHLNLPYTIMVDQSRLRNLGLHTLGNFAFIKSLPVQLVGKTQNSQSIPSVIFAFTSLENATRYINSGVSSNFSCKFDPAKQITCFHNAPANRDLSTILKQAEPLTPLQPRDPVSYILVKVAPGADLTEVQSRLNLGLPTMQAYTREEMAEKTLHYWVFDTGIGFILGLGSVIAVVVGVVIVSQILYASVSDHLKEFATLKAMGASDRDIYAVIVEQALWMAIAGYIPGMLICQGLKLWATAQGVVILITPVSSLCIFVVTIAMAIGSSFFAIRRVVKLDPATVFKV